MKFPKLKRDRAGMRVRTLVEMKNGFATVPAGTLATVTRWQGGAHLATDPCPHCGVKVHFSKVDENKLEPI